MERGERSMSIAARLSPSSSASQCCLLDLFASGKENDGEDGAGGGVWEGGGDVDCGGGCCEASVGGSSCAEGSGGVL